MAEGSLKYLKPFRLISSTALAMSIAGATAASLLRDAAKDMFAPLLSTTPAVADNPITPEKIDLGKMLFFDLRMSA